MEAEYESFPSKSRGQTEPWTRFMVRDHSGRFPDASCAWEGPCSAGVASMTEVDSSGFVPETFLFLVSAFIALRRTARNGRAPVVPGQPDTLMAGVAGGLR